MDQRIVTERVKFDANLLMHEEQIFQLRTDPLRSTPYRIAILYQVLTSTVLWCKHISREMRATEQEVNSACTLNLARVLPCLRYERVEALRTTAERPADLSSQPIILRKISTNINIHSPQRLPLSTPTRAMLNNARRQHRGLQVLPTTMFR